MRVSPDSPPDLQQRDALVLAHVDLVRALAAQIGRRLPSHVERAELVSVGVLGLIDAAQRYQPALGVPFDAFARRRVQGAMLDALRRLDRVPRSVRRLKRDLDRALTELRHRLGREPVDTEIAAALGVSVSEYDSMLDGLCVAGLSVAHASPADGDPDSLLSVAVDADGGPYAQLERRELQAQLARAIAELPEREQQILALSYQEELTLAEIGQVIGVGESRVSQLRTQAIARLRSRLREWLRASRAA
jgi:RNA polymerase sigma factor for flagellar operon FliA